MQNYRYPRLSAFGMRKTKPGVIGAGLLYQNIVIS
jgi:hypothetical protein